MFEDYGKHKHRFFSLRNVVYRHRQLWRQGFKFAKVKKCVLLSKQTNIEIQNYPHLLKTAVFSIKNKPKIYWLKMSSKKLLFIIENIRTNKLSSKYYLAEGLNFYLKNLFQMSVHYYAKLATWHCQKFQKDFCSVIPIFPCHCCLSKEGAGYLLRFRQLRRRKT